MVLKDGNRVWLKANKEEGFIRQEAVIIGIETFPQYPGKSDVLMVRVEPDPEDPQDDGLREVTLDQIEGF